MHIFLLTVSLAMALSHAANLRGASSQREFRIGTGGSTASRASALTHQRFSTSTTQNKPNQQNSKVSRSLKKVAESAPKETGMKTLYARPSTPPTKNNDTSLPSVALYSTVDVFFFLDFPIGAPKYVRKGYFWMLPQIASMYSKANLNETEADTRIHIISSSVDILKQSSVLGFYSHDLTYQLKQHAGLLSRIAPTVRNNHQEKKMLRWKAYSDIVSEWNKEAPESPIQRVLVTEDDVLLTVNAASLFDRTLKAIPSGTQVLNLAGGLSFFSTEGLAAFSTFIDEWYRGSAEDIEARSMDAVQREWTDALVLDRFIDAAPTNTPPNTTASIRLSAFMSSDSSSPSVEPKKLFSALGCVPMETYRTGAGIQFEVNGVMLNNRSDSSLINNSTDISVKSVNEKYPYCYLQFYDRNHKSLLYAYGRSLEILRQGEEKYTVSAHDSLHGDLLLSPVGSREIYHISSSDALRQFLPGREVFIARSFSNDDVIAHVPYSIITAFQSAPGPAHPWADGATVQFVGRSRTVFYVIKGVLHPIASGEVFERLKLKYNEVIHDTSYAGLVFDTLPFGAEIK